MTMADYETLYPGRFLKKEVLAAPKVIRILSVTKTDLEGERGIESKVVVKYKAADGEGEAIWNKTNAALAAIALNERDYEKWVGRLITIHNNPNVDLKGQCVGGIRVCGSPEMKAPKRVEIKRPRRKNPEVYQLSPTDKQGRPLSGTATATKSDAPPPPEPPPDYADSTDLADVPPDLSEVA
jgi:hypothetical protein